MTHKNRLRLLCDFFALKNDANVPSKCNKQNTNKKKKYFLLAKSRIRMRQSGSILKCHGSTTLVIFILAYPTAGSN
jgi:hypothetical protein